MNIVIVILAILVTPFVLAFLLGIVKASISGSDKKRRAVALIALSQMTGEQREALKDIFVAYKQNDVEEANSVSEQVSPETINYLVGFFDYCHRPVEYSSGLAGKLIWETFENKLRKLGYSETVSKIIPGVVIDNYNDVLEEMLKNKRRVYEE